MWNNVGLRLGTSDQIFRLVKFQDEARQLKAPNGRYIIILASENAANFDYQRLSDIYLGAEIIGLNNLPPLP